MKHPIVTKTETTTTVTIELRGVDKKMFAQIAKDHRLDEGELFLAALAFLSDAERSDLNKHAIKEEFAAFLDAERASILEFDEE